MRYVIEIDAGPDNWQVTVRQDCAEAPALATMLVVETHEELRAALDSAAAHVLHREER